METTYLEPKPDKQTIWFMGQPLSLRRLADAEALDRTLLSRIFSGKRKPTLFYSRAIARALEVSIDDFLAALEHRTHENIQ